MDPITKLWKIWVQVQYYYPCSETTTVLAFPRLTKNSHGGQCCWLGNHSELHYSLLQAPIIEGCHFTRQPYLIRIRNKTAKYCQGDISLYSSDYCYFRETPHLSIVKSHQEMKTSCHVTFGEDIPLFNNSIH